MRAVAGLSKSLPVLHRLKDLGRHGFSSAVLQEVDDLATGVSEETSVRPANTYGTFS